MLSHVLTLFLLWVSNEFGQTLTKIKLLNFFFPYAYNILIKIKSLVLPDMSKLMLMCPDFTFQVVFNALFFFLYIHPIG